MFTRWLVCLPGFMAQYSEDSAAAAFDCWTLVDFDGDGDLDLVKTRPVDPKFTAGVRKVMYYEQAGDRGKLQGERVRRYKMIFLMFLNIVSFDLGPGRRGCLGISKVVPGEVELQFSSARRKRQSLLEREFDGPASARKSVFLLPCRCGSGPRWRSGLDPGELSKCFRPLSLLSAAERS